jgi:hypothetical protein
MEKKNIVFKFIFISLSIFCLFLVIGWYKSDAHFYKQVILEEQLDTPDRIFSFICKKFDKNKPSRVHRNVTPYHLFNNHKRLFCDEGAAIMATLNYYNGYETRFVRVINQKGIDSHTFLQVREKGVWVSYDYTYRYKNASKEQLETLSGLQIKNFKYYQYPRVYNKLINANYFLKKFALLVRGIDESD